MRRIRPRVPGQPLEPGVVRDASRHAAAAGRAGPNQAAGPVRPDRRRLRHLHRARPIAGRRPAAQHHPRLLLLEALRLHRVAAGRGRRPPGQRVRRAAGQPARDRSRGAAGALRVADHRPGSAAFHRPDGRRQPRRRPEPHRRPVAAAASPDDVVLAVRAARSRRRLPAALPADRPRAAGRVLPRARHRHPR